MADSKKLIDRGLWAIPTPRLDGWYRQFCGVEEQFFAACLLNQLIFRTARQFESNLKSLFRGDVGNQIFPSLADLTFCRVMAARPDPRIRLVPVICEADPPTKSGPLVLRRLQRILRLNPSWMIWPWQAGPLIDAGAIDHVVFVDDFLGSGGQFEKFIKQWDFLLRAERCSYLYAPVVAHATGIKYIADNVPFVSVVTSERLDQAHMFFSTDVWESLGKNSVSALEAEDWYRDFAKRKHIEPRSAGCLGVGDLALTFCFGHSTPNNSLPILWYESADWQPLLER